MSTLPKAYTHPQLEWIRFPDTDVIVTSDGDEGEWDPNALEQDTDF